MSVTTQLEVVIKWTSLLVSSSECNLDLLLILYLTNSTNLQIMRRQLEAVFKELVLSMPVWKVVQVYIPDHITSTTFRKYCSFDFFFQLDNDCLNSNNWQSDTIDWHYWQPIKLADLWILEKVWFFPITPQLSSSRARDDMRWSSLIRPIYYCESGKAPAASHQFRSNCFVSLLICLNRQCCWWSHFHGDKINSHRNGHSALLQTP